jgi:predicted  nucleic acid-binding Zn-ribbon protein
MNEIEKLTENFWRYVLSNDTKNSELEKRISELESDAGKCAGELDQLTERICKLERRAGKKVSAGKSTVRKNKKERSKLEKALDAFVAREARKERQDDQENIRRLKVGIKEVV